MYDMAEAGRILKAVYGCTPLWVISFDAGRTVNQRRDSARRMRRECEQKLQSARRLRDAWEIGLHKGHLVGLDRTILGAA